MTWNKEATPTSIQDMNAPVDTGKIRDILESNDGARVRTWLDICSRCGLCADSCFVYLANGNDPELSPAFKVKATLGELYRRNGMVDRAFLEHCFKVAWLQCTMCKRCALYCPFGIDISVMISVVRSVCNSQGVWSERLHEYSENCRKSGNHMDLPASELTETCDWMLEEAEDDYSNITIPIDKPGAKYMFTINPREPVYYPQDISYAAVIFSVAEENWTLPTFGWDTTNLPMLLGDRQLAGRQVENVYRKAIELGVENILITECGHAYRSLKYEGPYLAGYSDGKPPVNVVHSVELYYQYLRDGRITIDPAKKLKKPCTYQDPCNVSRNGGLWREARELIGHLVTDFRDMNPNGAYNHCCGGGSGIMPMGPDYKPPRIANGRVKAEQIRATGAEVVIAPCHNCFDQINDLGEEYDLNIKVVSLKELIAESMVIPEKFQAAE